MEYLFAPMEGITGHIYRNAYEECIGGIDAYYTPFISANPDGDLNQKERRDILPENNEGIRLIPQILAKDPRAFLNTAGQIKAYGYDEINLNLGCPMRTVTAKGKGAGMLRDVEALDRFLDVIYNGFDGKISIKTRIGYTETQEWTALFEVFSHYPVSKLIVHPRLQKEMYNGVPHRDVFAQIYAQTPNKEILCYNGDLETAEDIVAVQEQFPETHTCMIGRGFLRRPGFATMGIPDKQLLKRFHRELYEVYREEFQDERNVLFKMKELWNYLYKSVTADEKDLKPIRKANRYAEYEAAVRVLFGKMQ